MSESQRWMTTVEVARAFGVSRMTVQRWADNGYLVCRTLPSGHRRFDRVSVERRASERGGAVDQAVAEVVARAPELTGEHRRRIAALLEAS